MSITDNQFFQNADLNAQEFANRQILLKGNGVPNFSAPIYAEYIDLDTDTRYVNKTNLASDWHVAAGGGAGITGAVFITDITPQNGGDNVGAKVFSSDGNVLDSCVSNTDQITVHVVALMGPSSYKPAITVQGETVTLTEDSNKALWVGTIDIDRSGDDTITAAHEDGATHVCTVATDTGPEVAAATFTGGYPASQTELKAADTYDLDVTSDTPMVGIEVDDFGAAIAQSFSFAETSSTTITVVIADRGNTTEPYAARVRCVNANGSYGNWYTTSDAGTVDGTNVVTLNNLHPVITVDHVAYPAGQQALKDSEEATVEHTITNYDEVLYQTPLSEVSTLSPTVFDTSKVARRNAGDYNISTPNFTITATRTANGAAVTEPVVVNIAHTQPQLTLSAPAARLRSGGNQGTVAQNHNMTVTSDQQLLAAPVISAPVGSLQGSMSANGDNTVFTQDLRVHDDDEKGSHTMTLTTATNLAGIVVSTFTGSADFTLGGFVSRVLTVPAFAQEVAIGTSVTDTAKLDGKDKDLAPMSYQADFTDNVKTYTITGPTGVLNPAGDLLYWTDSQAVNNNTTGLATITIEELV